MLPRMSRPVAPASPATKMPVSLVAAGGVVQHLRAGGVLEADADPGHLRRNVADHDTTAAALVRGDRVASNQVAGRSGDDRHSVIGLVGDRVTGDLVVGVGVVELHTGELVERQRRVLHLVAQRARVELHAVVEVGDRARTDDGHVIEAVVPDADTQAGPVDRVAVEVDRDAVGVDDQPVTRAVRSPSCWWSRWRHRAAPPMRPERVRPSLPWSGRPAPPGWRHGGRWKMSVQTRTSPSNRTSGKGDVTDRCRAARSPDKADVKKSLLRRCGTSVARVAVAPTDRRASVP